MEIADTVFKIIERNVELSRHFFMIKVPSKLAKGAYIKRNN